MITVKAQKFWFSTFCLWAVCTMSSMAPMSIAAGLFVAVSIYFISKKIPASERAAQFSFYSHSMYGRATIFLLALSALVTLYSYFSPPLGIPMENPFELKKSHYFLLPIFTAFAFSSLLKNSSARLEQHWFWKFFWAMAAFVSLVSILQFWAASFLPEKILENRFFRPIPGSSHFHGQGLMYFHLSFATAMGFAYSYAVAKIFWRQSAQPMHRWLIFWVLSLLTGLGIFYSFSRISWLALLAVPLVLAFLRKPKMGFILLFVAILGVPYLWQNNQTFRGRFTEFGSATDNGLVGRMIVWRASLEMIKDRPLVGVGFGKTGQYSEAYAKRYYGEAQWFSSHAHNNLLDAFASTGVFGFLAYIFWWAGLAFYSWRQFREAHWDEKWLPAAGLAAIVSFQINGLTQVNFYDGKSQHALMLWAGIVLALEWRRHQQKGIRFDK